MHLQVQVRVEGVKLFRTLQCSLQVRYRLPLPQHALPVDYGDIRTIRTRTQAGTATKFRRSAKQLRFSVSSARIVSTKIYGRHMLSERRREPILDPTQDQIARCDG